MRWLFIPPAIILGMIICGIFYGPWELIVIGVIYAIIIVFIIQPDNLFP